MKIFIDDTVLIDNQEYEFIVTDQFKDNPVLEIKSTNDDSKFVSMMTGADIGENHLTDKEREFVDQYMRRVDNHNEEFSMWFSYIDEYIQDDFTVDEYQNLLSYMKLYESQLLVPFFNLNNNSSTSNYKEWIISLKNISKGE